MTERIQKVLSKQLSALDEPVIEYLSNVVAEEKFRDEKQLFDKLGDLLVSYDACGDEAAAQKICSALFRELSKEGIITATKAAAAKPRAASEAWVAATRDKLSVGIVVQAKYYEDGGFYTATIDKLPDPKSKDTKYHVTFTEYGNQEKVSLEEIKVNPNALAASAKDLSPTPTNKPAETLTKAAAKSAAPKAAATNTNDQPPISVAAKGMTLAELARLKAEEEDDEKDEKLDSGDGEDGVVRLLKAPVSIQQLAAAETAAVNASMNLKKLKKENTLMAAEEAAPTRKQIRNAAKDRAREESQKKKELDRKLRAEERRMAALQTYLNSTATSRSKEVNISNFSLATPDGGNELLSNAALRLVTGRRYGLVGRNGVGKTTLMQAVSHYELPGFPTHLRVMHVEQEVIGDSRTVMECVLASDVERELLLKEEKTLTAKIDDINKKRDGFATAVTSAAEEAAAAEKKKKTEEEELKISDNRAYLKLKKAEAANPVPKKSTEQLTLEAAKKKLDKLESDLAESQESMQRIYNRMKDIDVWGAQARASTILNGLQFPDKKQRAATNTLSGGWRMRVALACALFVSPDLLLLDEPTNHLDFPAVLWLEDYLCKYKDTVVIVSHDRYFLNNVITDVMHFHEKKVVTYKGTYDTFERVREEKLKQQKREHDSQLMKRAHMQKFIDKFRYNAKRASLVQSRLKAMSKMTLVDDVFEEGQWHFEFPDPDYMDVPIISCTDMAFQWDSAGGGRSNYLLSGVSCRVDMDSRVGVLGANGVGKTTLIHILTGDLQPSEGQVVRNGSARIASFAQHHVDQLNLELSPLELLCEMWPKIPIQTLRGHLGKFGITGDLGTQRIGTLSGGQKSRVAFAVVTWKNPHLLILDEPTNHLDLETIDALIIAVNTFGGGVLLVSHDQHFLSSVCSEFWGVSDGKVKRFDSFAASKRFSYSTES